jgi:isopentenyl phosphate kinase
MVVHKLVMTRVIVRGSGSFRHKLLSTFETSQEQAAAAKTSAPGDEFEDL